MPWAERDTVEPTVTNVSNVPLPLFRSGKVREVFDLGDRLLIVATDRLSAFDVVLPTPIPGKGRLLTAISNFWFDRTSTLIPNHRTGDSIDSLDIDSGPREQLRDRSSVVWKANRIDIECVVRGRLAGSGWKEYRTGQTLAGEPLPSGLSQGAELPQPRFTPATKNDSGHDQNISRSELVDRIGVDLSAKLEEASRDLFSHAREIAADAGFVLADTKFEFGWIDGELTLIDEALTPDSSRYWDVATWDPGSEPPGFDKQVVRDWLESSGWNKEPPGPVLPPDIVETTRYRYAEVLDRLTRTLEPEEKR